MRSSSSAIVAARRQPWPSPSYTWCSTGAPAARSASAIAADCASGHRRVGVAVQQEHRRADLARVRDRRAVAVRVGRAPGSGPTSRERVARLEAVRRRREVERDRTPGYSATTACTRSGCCAATSSAVIPPALPPMSATRAGVGPPFLHRVPDAGGDVGDVALAPAPGERLRVRARRSRSSRGSSAAARSSPAARRPAPAAIQSASAWPVGPPCTCTSSGRALRAADAVGRAPQQAVHGRAPRLPRDRPRLDEPGRLEPADRAAGDRRAGPSRSRRARRPAAA